MNYHELQKLYPEFKIPYEKEAEYYIKCLMLNDPTLETKFNDFAALTLTEPDPVRYKFKKYDEIMAYFKQNNLDLNALDKNDPSLNSGYTLKEFNDYKPNKFYISIDLREANWQAFKYCGTIKKYTESFEDFTVNNFDLHPAIARSKSFRQFLFGNTNPKRLQSIQKYMMDRIESQINNYHRSKIVGKKSDELLFEYEKEDDWVLSILYFNSSINAFEYNVKVAGFKVSEHTNFNEFVRIKYEYTNGNYDFSNKIKLMGVPGNRYFLHYKTLILKQPLDERDLYFVQDKKLAKWQMEFPIK